MLLCALGGECWQRRCAQVYKAVLRETGETVAVKVQRPFVLETVSLDLFLMREAAEFVASLKLGRTDFVALLVSLSLSLSARARALALALLFPLGGREGRTRRQEPSLAPPPSLFRSLSFALSLSLSGSCLGARGSGV